jgi:hypothetical protein
LPGDHISKSSHTPAASDGAETDVAADETLSREQELRRKLELRNREIRENEEPVWYTLFDVEREDLEAVVGWIMRLYQAQKSVQEKTVIGLVVGGKKAVRAWADEHAEAV